MRTLKIKFIRGQQMTAHCDKFFGDHDSKSSMRVPILHFCLFHVARIRAGEAIIAVAPQIGIPTDAVQHSAVVIKVVEYVIVHDILLISPSLVKTQTLSHILCLHTQSWTSTDIHNIKRMNFYLRELDS